ncbi:hypothetical protein ARHIZOSPH14_05980 [Agromyces rhizosphaerae]|uniref:Uncharacterized protein n=1 Tax=Agromyces rhizosphaerae TaxID=88374 RepID=A0A9W6FNC5_9MICO|nr:hypothetical protein [Agromyces rhizosphaerae]GLI26356.1 hypothetical protein ARHIZOSPH14_05980 [Agromyces rhizosphaerae]
MTSTQTATAVLERAVATTDPAARNRLITLCYREIAFALADVIGRKNLNWFAFGAWASGTAGAVIRGEGTSLGLGSEGVAAGNLAIIRDVAPPLLRWLIEVERTGEATPEAMGRALVDPVFDGRPGLAAAVRCYQRAAMLAREADAHGASDDRRAELEREIAERVLLGNALLGAHEQELVDRFIDEAMPLGGLFGLVTTRFVHLETPDGPIDVTEDVAPPPYLAGAQFPISLTALTYPELVLLFLRFHQSPGEDTTHSDAPIWEDYDERMGFILTFFRAHQCDPRYFEVPSRFLPEGAPEHH